VFAAYWRTILGRVSTFGPSGPQDGAAIYTTERNGQCFEVVTPDAGTPKLCRRLVAAGCDDQPLQAVDHAGQARFHGRSIHQWAELTITERGRRGMRVDRWRPRPPHTIRGPAQAGAERTGAVAIPSRE
jgi:hypothetical protein